MANSVKVYPSLSATQGTFAFPFSYLNANDIKAYVDGTLVFEDNASTNTAVNGTTYTVAFQSEGATTLTFSPDVAVGSEVRIQRNTDLTSKVVDFADGAVLTEVSLDDAVDQVFFAAQEAIDKANESITETADGKWDAQSKVIKNVANPSAANDAVNKTYLEDTWLSLADKAQLNALDTDNLDTVADDVANVNTVATNIADVNTVADRDADIGTVADRDSDIGTVAGQISPTNNIATVASDSTDIQTVAGDSSDIQTLADISTDIQTLADIEDGTTDTDAIQKVAAIDSNVSTVAGIDSDVTDVAGVSSDVTTVAGEISPTNNISTVAGKATEIGNLGTAQAVADMNVLAPAAVRADMDTLADIATDITTVAHLEDGTTATNGISDLAAISSDITAVANISQDIQDVQDEIANLQTVANDLNEATSEIETVAASIANVDLVGADITNVNTVATNISDVNNFADTYYVSATEPSGTTLGDLWFDTTADVMKVKASGGFVNAGSSVNGTSERQTYIAGTASGNYGGSSLTTFPVTYDAGFVDVYLNGIKMRIGTDVTATSGTDVVFASAVTSGDVVDIVAFGTFELSNFSIGDANNVDLTGLVNNQYLQYNSTSGNFEPASVNTDLSNDTTPQLGGNLDTNGNNINFGDGDRANFGASNDLVIRHDGTNSYISDAGTGSLIVTAADQMVIQKGDGTNRVADFHTTNGTATLKYQGNNKLATTSTGVDITGTLNASTDVQINGASAATTGKAIAMAIVFGG